MEKKEILCLEYNVFFCRILNHWEEFEKNSFVVLNNILEEIDKELSFIALEEFKLNRNYF